ncbi:hypothetical protein KEM55_007373 [Ascosphaera atra]|nr:hypothetical protein KEM55_007373 [Ascosphaera atra]
MPTTATPARSVAATATPSPRKAAVGKTLSERGGPTPAPVLAASETPANMPTPAAAPRAPPTMPSFKCADTNCKHHVRGFATQDDLDLHVADEHTFEKQPSVEQGLEYYLESLELAKKRSIEATQRQHEKHAAAQAAAGQQAREPEATASANQKDKTIAAHGQEAGAAALDAAKDKSKKSLAPSVASGAAGDPKPHATTPGLRYKDLATAAAALQAKTIESDVWNAASVPVDLLRGMFSDFNDPRFPDFTGLGLDPVDELLLVTAEGEIIHLEQPAQLTPISRSSLITDSSEEPAVAQSPKSSKADQMDVDPTDDSPKKRKRSDEGTPAKKKRPLWQSLPGNLPAFVDPKNLEEPLEDIDWDLFMDLNNTQGP